MNVYDFDKTIYKSDSTVDFYFYVLSKNPKVIKYIPKQMVGFILYFFKKIDKTKMKEYFYTFLNGIYDIDKTVDLFWSINYSKINAWYISCKKEDDVVISASPEFLLNPICKRLNIKTLIASNVDKSTGKYDGKNCHGQEKVRRFKEKFKDAKISKFYSDSMSDMPMASISDEAYLVKKNKIKKWI